MGADVCRTSSWASRRPPDVISTVATLDPRWRRRKWRHPGPGAGFSSPVVEGGGKWRPFRFRSPSWVTSFAGTGNEVIQDGDRKRKGRHFPPPSTMGLEKPALYYWSTAANGSNQNCRCCRVDTGCGMNPRTDGRTDGWTDEVLTRHSWWGGCRWKVCLTKFKNSH